MRNPFDARGNRTTKEWVQGIVSADTAVEYALDYGWPAEDELLLYVIHGTLHLAGHRDKADDEVVAMRDAEAKYLRLAGIEPPALAAEETHPQ